MAAFATQYVAVVLNMPCQVQQQWAVAIQQYMVTTILLGCLVVAEDHVSRITLRRDVEAVGSIHFPGSVQRRQFISMDLVLQCGILLGAARGDCCIEQQGQERLAELCLLFAGFLINKVLLALLHNFQYLRPAVGGCKQLPVE